MRLLLSDLKSNILSAGPKNYFPETVVRGCTVTYHCIVVVIIVVVVVVEVVVVVVVVCGVYVQLVYLMFLGRGTM